METLVRLPFTLIFLGLMVAANWAAGTLSGRLPFRRLAEWGMSHQRLVRGEAFRLLTGTFLSHDRRMFARQIVFAAGVIGAYEWQFGTAQAVLMFAAINILGTLIVLLGVLPLIAAYVPSAAQRPLHTLDVGMSAGGFGLLGALLAGLPAPFVCLGVGLAGVGVKIWLRFEAIADTAHLVCLILGFGAQMVLVWLYNPWG